ncbi:MAG: hypothetical protein ACTHK8_03435 [Ginsengibacter sp.]
MQETNKKVAFRVLRNELFDALSQLKRSIKSTKRKKTILEVTITDSFLELLVPGIQLQITAATKGAAKFTVLLDYFLEIIKAEKPGTLDFMISENSLNLRVFAFSVQTTFFEDDKILRSINLPINYTDKDIVKLYLSEKYTNEEIAFNKLNERVERAMLNTKKDIDKVSSIMKAYGFNKKEVESIVLDKLKKMSNL